jgi:uncharacterized protein (TIGR02271 family)
MLSDSDVQRVAGSTVVGTDEEKIGKAGQVFLDDDTDRPEWVTVNTGLFGSNESFVPLEGASFDGDALRVPYTKDEVKDAPNVDVAAGHLDVSEERRLYEYYGRAYDGTSTGDDRGYDRGYDREGVSEDDRSDASRTADVADTSDLSRAGTVSADTSRTGTDDAMTRSEERLEVGTESRETGRVRLRKYVTTETETVDVPVRKERAVLETEPVTSENVGDATSGPDITEDEHEVVLREERPVVEKTVEPVERVRLGTETVTDQETVTEEVRKEHVEADGDVAGRR